MKSTAKLKSKQLWSTSLGWQLFSVSAALLLMWVRACGIIAFNLNDLSRFYQINDSIWLNRFWQEIHVKTYVPINWDATCVRLLGFFEELTAADKTRPIQQFLDAPVNHSFVFPLTLVAIWFGELLVRSTKGGLSIDLSSSEPKLELASLSLL